MAGRRLTCPRSRTASWSRRGTPTDIPPAGSPSIRATFPATSRFFSRSIASAIAFPGQLGTELRIELAVGYERGEVPKVATERIATEEQLEPLQTDKGSGTSCMEILPGAELSATIARIGRPSGRVSLVQTIALRGAVGETLTCPRTEDPEKG